MRRRGGACDGAAPRRAALLPLLLAAACPHGAGAVSQYQCLRQPGLPGCEQLRETDELLRGARDAGAGAGAPAVSAAAAGGGGGAAGSAAAAGQLMVRADGAAQPAEAGGPTTAKPGDADTAVLRDDVARLQKKLARCLDEKERVQREADGKAAVEARAVAAAWWAEAAVEVRVTAAAAAAGVALLALRGWAWAASAVWSRAFPPRRSELHDHVEECIDFHLALFEHAARWQRWERGWVPAACGAAGWAALLWALAQVYRAADIGKHGGWVGWIMAQFVGLKMYQYICVGIAAMCASGAIAWLFVYTSRGLSAVWATTPDARVEASLRTQRGVLFRSIARQRRAGVPDGELRQTVKARCEEICRGAMASAGMEPLQPGIAQIGAAPAEAAPALRAPPPPPRNPYLAGRSEEE